MKKNMNCVDLVHGHFQKKSSTLKYNASIAPNISFYDSYRCQIRINSILSPNSGSCAASLDFNSYFLLFFVLGIRRGLTLLDPGGGYSTTFLEFAKFRLISVFRDSDF